MKKVAVFGNAGGGKSTLSQHLAEMTGLPWVPLDLLQYQPGGGEVPHTEFKAAHDELLTHRSLIFPTGSGTKGMKSLHSKGLSERSTSILARSKVVSSIYRLWNVHEP